MSGLPHPPRDDDVREIGMVEDVNGNPLYLAVYRGQVNIAGFKFDEAKCEEFSQYFVRAQWEAAKYDACPVEAVFPSGRIPCTLLRNHPGAHSYASGGRNG